MDVRSPSPNVKRNTINACSLHTPQTIGRQMLYLPPTKEEVIVLPAFVCLSVCLLARLLKNACMDLDEMLRVDRCRDMDELINF